MSKQTETPIKNPMELMQVTGVHWSQRVKQRITAYTARRSAGRTRLIELCAFALFLPALGVLLFKDNPTGLDAGFPWALTGCMLFAARYGVIWGIACAVLNGVFINFPVEVFAQHSAQHLSLALGNIVICLAIGDATSSWRRRSQRAEAENHYLRHRLKEFGSDYHVLKVSHGQLEEHMAGQRLSLREALQQLQPMLSTNANGIQAGNELMALFSQFCSIQIAGLYAMNADGKLVSQAVATHGDMFDLPLFDLLLRAALDERELVSIKLESLAENHHEKSLLAVLPIADSEGYLHGVLAIKDMHFMAFQQQNLNLLALLGSYVGNLLTRSRGQSNTSASWFLAELNTALRFATAHNAESSLLSFKFDDAVQSTEVRDFVGKAIRSLDASWSPETQDGTQVLCVLLPLMDDSQGQAFVKRINEAVSQQFGQTMTSMLEGQRLKQIRRADTLESCFEFLAVHVGQEALAQTVAFTSTRDGSGVA